MSKKGSVDAIEIISPKNRSSEITNISYRVFPSFSIYFIQLKCLNLFDIIIYKSMLTLKYLAKNFIFRLVFTLGVIC